MFTSLYPNHINPDFGIFIKNRMQHVHDLKDCHVTVVAPVPYCPAWKFLGGWYEFSKVKKYEKMNGIELYHPRYLLIPKISMVAHGFLMFMGTAGLIKRLHRRKRFDLLDVHYVYPDGYAGMMLAKMLGLPFFVSARGTDINDFPKFKMIKPLIQKVLSTTNGVISVCTALRDQMVSLGCREDKITVIPNGIDTQRFEMIDRRIARKKLNLPLNQKIILSVGALIPRKGHHISIHSVKEIIKSEPAAHLYIAGKGEMASILEKKVQELGLKNYVTFLGHLPNDMLSNWYSAADVSCLASSREGWANVIMESMACGTPVVATNVWGAPEIITTPDVGILVERKTHAIADALIQALKVPWNRKKIRNHVSHRSWTTVAAEVHDVFSRISN